MNKLLIYFGGYRGCMGLSLRGYCTEPADAVYLQQALTQTAQHLQVVGLTHLWLDCQRLETLSWQGQRALLQADNQARAAHVVPYWCGLQGPLVEQMTNSGLYPLLCTPPAAAYQGPLMLLADNLPASSRIVIG